MKATQSIILVATLSLVGISTANADTGKPGRKGTITVYGPSPSKVISSKRCAPQEIYLGLHALRNRIACSGQSKILRDQRKGNSPLLLPGRERKEVEVVGLLQEWTDQDHPRSGRF